MNNIEELLLDNWLVGENSDWLADYHYKVVVRHASRRYPIGLYHDDPSLGR